MTVATNISCLPVSELDHSELIDDSTLFLTSQFDAGINSYLSHKVNAKQVQDYVLSDNTFVDRNDVNALLQLNTPRAYVTGIEQRDGKIVRLISSYFSYDTKAFFGCGVLNGNLLSSYVQEVDYGYPQDAIMHVTTENSWLVIQGDVVQKSQFAQLVDSTQLSIDVVPTLDIYINDNLVYQAELDGFHEDTYFSTVNWAGMPIQAETSVMLKLGCKTQSGDTVNLKFESLERLKTRITFYEYELYANANVQEMADQIVKKPDVQYTDPQDPVGHPHTYVEYIDQDNGKINPHHKDLPVYSCSFAQDTYNAENSVRLGSLVVNNVAQPIYVPGTISFDYSQSAIAPSWNVARVTSTGLSYQALSKCQVIIKAKTAGEVSPVNISINGTIVEQFPSDFLANGIRAQYLLAPADVIVMSSIIDQVDLTHCSLTIIPEKTLT